MLPSWHARDSRFLGVFASRRHAQQVKETGEKSRTEPSIKSERLLKKRDSGRCLIKPKSNRTKPRYEDTTVTTQNHSHYNFTKNQQSDATVHHEIPFVGAGCPAAVAAAVQA
jgi:hypothetical protein